MAVSSVQDLLLLMLLVFTWLRGFMWLSGCSVLLDVNGLELILRMVLPLLLVHTPWLLMLRHHVALPLVVGSVAPLLLITLRPFRAFD